MIPSREKFSRVVRFTTEADDQTLIQLIGRALEKQPHRSFSDLCKQALQEFLRPDKDTSSAATLLALQQQVVDLQLQLMRLQEETTLKQQLSQLSDRLGLLESQGDRPPVSSDSSVAPPVSTPAPHEEEPIHLDPLLSRLAPLLEDF